jgi:nucleotide-binding universal stress UspA family protein
MCTFSNYGWYTIERNDTVFAHILVPLDGSARAEEALPVAARIARASGGSIHLLEVLRPLIDYDGGYDTAPPAIEQVVESEMAVVTNYLQTLVASPVLEGLQVTTEVVPGFPAQYILAVARSGEFDLTVLCSHGRTGFTRWVLGSVARTLAHESTVPTLVLRENEPASLLTQPDAARTLRAFVPLDGSQFAEAALEPAAHLVASLTAPALGELHLTQVVKLFQTPAEEGFGSSLDAEATAHARAYLAQVAERWQPMTKELGISFSWSAALEADVASALLSRAEQGEQGQGTADSRGCDLIAISTHGRHGLERWVMGSVTDRLLTTTKLPILIVRPPRKG